MHPQDSMIVICYITLDANFNGSGVTQKPVFSEHKQILVYAHALMLFKSNCAD